MSADPGRRIYVALDTDDLALAQRLAQSLAGSVGGFKVGLQLFGSHGVAAVESIAAYGDVFLDLKFHDIPNTVAGAAAAITRLGVRWFTVHAGGGASMMRRAVEAAGEAAAERGVQPPGVLAVTVLTSHDDAELTEIGLSGPCDRAVLRLATLARSAGVAGAVCSPREVATVRQVFPGATLVVPGIRPATGAVDADDQTRVATPASAVREGADLLVIGRPITRAADARAAVASITAELESV